MSDKYTVTIGIPAFNEQANISTLLEDLKKQVVINYQIEKILLVSDGSTDLTVMNAKQSNLEKLQVIDSRERLGVAARQNEIISETDSDVLIILNADINIQDTLFIENLIKPITKGVADLVTPELKQFEPENYFEKILYISMRLKTEMYEQFNNGLNVYTCAGPARAFSKKLYKKLTFKESSNEDAYSYLFAVKHGFTYQHIHDTAIYFRLPNNFSDHKKQSSRFFQSRKSLISEFGSSFITLQYKMPTQLIVKTITTYCFKHPFELFFYTLILCSIRLFAKKNTNGNTWEASKSSKTLH